MEAPFSSVPFSSAPPLLHITFIGFMAFMASDLDFTFIAFIAFMVFIASDLDFPFMVFMASDLDSPFIVFIAFMVFMASDLDSPFIAFIAFMVFMASDLDFPFIAFITFMVFIACKEKQLNAEQLRGRYERVNQNCRGEANTEFLRKYHFPEQGQAV